MNANDVIESYVTDVAVQLPRKQRNDVAFELRALLRDELQGRAQAAGRAPDAAMATDMVRAFGRPGDVAARYRPTLTVIDPADGPLFVKASAIGLVVIWVAGLLVRLRHPVGSPDELLRVFSQWWGGAVIPSLWWPGVLAVSFGLSAWARRRWPRAGEEWTPRALDRIRGGRASLVLAVLGVLCGVIVLADPRGVMEALFGGQIAPAATAMFTYTDAFRMHELPLLLAFLLLNVPLLAIVMVIGRWTTALRLVERALTLATCAVMIWTVLDGPAFLSPVTDRMFKLMLVLVVVSSLVGVGLAFQRSVKPAPSQEAEA